MATDGRDDRDFSGNSLNVADGDSSARFQGVLKEAIYTASNFSSRTKNDCTYVFGVSRTTSTEAFLSHGRTSWATSMSCKNVTLRCWCRRQRLAAARPHRGRGCERMDSDGGIAWARQCSTSRQAKMSQLFCSAKIDVVYQVNFSDAKSEWKYTLLAEDAGWSRRGKSCLNPPKQRLGTRATLYPWRTYSSASEA